MVILLVATFGVVILAGCDRLRPREAVQLTILYTSDEHGWMAPTADSGGAAGMLARWREDEGYTEDGPFLVLSGGDIWTGPALSTWFEGEPMVEVMNLMGYDAVAVGNHEFDFAIEGLRERGAQAEFPFLAANIRTTGGDPIDFALPYVVQTVSVGEGTLEVGIVGLASTRTPGTTMPTHVADLVFLDYPAALSQAVSEVRDDGADVIVVTSHLCGPELQALAKTASQLGIAMLGGGHCHTRASRVEEGVALVEAGWRMEAYGRVDLTVDPVSGDVRDVEVTVKPNPAGEEDPEIAAVVAGWQAELDDALLVTIGYTEDGIGRGSDAMHALVMDAWLTGYPADIAMCNPGSFRQEIDPGEITLAEIVGVLPFDNTLVDVTITGQDVMRAYQHGSRRPAVSGLEQRGARFYVNGEPLDPAATYHVLINDYMYAGGDGYTFAETDPDAYMTGIDWRQPVIEWLSDLDTSPDDPLEGYLDGGGR